MPSRVDTSVLKWPLAAWVLALVVGAPACILPTAVRAQASGASDAPAPDGAAAATAAAVGALGAPVAASSPPPSSGSPPSPSRRFQRLDTNGDGYLTREEARKSDSLFNHFDVVDTDRDGRISVGEMREAWRARLEARRKALPKPAVGE